MRKRLQSIHRIAIEHAQQQLRSDMETTLLARADNRLSVLCLRTFCGTGCMFWSDRLVAHRGRQQFSAAADVSSQQPRAQHELLQAESTCSSSYCEMSSTQPDSHARAMTLLSVLTYWKTYCSVRSLPLYSELVELSELRQPVFKTPGPSLRYKNPSIALIPVFSLC